jgi:hypothetical protein
MSRILILQSASDTGDRSSTEVRAVRTATMLMDGFSVVNCTAASLDAHRDALIGGAMPVGSVEFIRKAFEVMGVQEPANISYPPGCEPHLHRQVQKSTAHQVVYGSGAHFVKPLTTKAFTGFVLDRGYGSPGMSDHDLEQYHALFKLPRDTPVWVSEPVKWLSEWRYTVRNGSIVGRARYDQLEDKNTPEPDIAAVNACIADLNIDHPHAVDFGVLSTGQSALVEVNDFWAIGLYEGSLIPTHYLKLLLCRWDSICKQTP